MLTHFRCFMSVHVNTHLSFVSDPCFYSSLFVNILIVSKPPFFFPGFILSISHKRRRKRETYCLYTFSSIRPFFERVLNFSNSFVEEGEQGKYYSFLNLLHLACSKCSTFLFIQFLLFSKHFVKLMLFFYLSFDWIPPLTIFIYSDRLLLKAALSLDGLVFHFLFNFWVF